MKKIITAVIVFALALFMTVGIGATEFLSDEVANKFVDLFYDVGSDSASSAADILTGKKEGTLEEIKEIYKNAVSVFNVINQDDLFSGTTAEVLKNTGTLTRVASGSLDVYENVASFSESENSMQKTIDGFQIIEGFLKTINKSDVVPTNISFALKCVEVGLEIGGILEKAYLAENLSIYEASLMIAYYTGDELPLQSAPPILIGSQITQEEADALYAAKYLEYSIKRLGVSSGGGNSGSDSGESTPDTGNGEDTIVDNTVTAATTLSRNTYINGDLVVRYPLDLGGKILTVNGDLIINGNLVISSGTLYVKGNVLHNGSTLSMSGGEAIIYGDFLAKTGNMYLTGGALKIGGSFLSEKAGNATYSTHVLQMTDDNAYMLVEKDFYFDVYTGGDFFTAGTLEVKGNFSQKSTCTQSHNTAYMNFRASGTHKVVLSGSGAQNIHFDDLNSYFNILEVKNQSGEITFSSPVHFNMLDGDLYYSGLMDLRGGESILNCNKISGDSLTLTGASLNVTDGMTISVRDELYISGTVTQNGGKIEAGNIEHNGSSLGISGGEMICKNDFLAKTGNIYLTGGALKIGGSFLSEKAGNSTYSTHVLQMTDDNAYMLVGGTFYIDSYTGGDFYTAGTLELKGDFVQRSTCTQSHNTAYMNFRAGGTHKVIFSGNKLQTVVFEDTQSRFNEVIYENERVRTLSVDEYNRLIIGDIDGDREVGIKDVLFVCSALLDKTYNPSADVDANGKITLYDVMYVLKRTAMQ